MALLYINKFVLPTQNAHDQEHNFSRTPLTVFQTLWIASFELRQHIALQTIWSITSLTRSAGFEKQTNLSIIVLKQTQQFNWMKVYGKEDSLYVDIVVLNGHGWRSSQPVLMVVLFFQQMQKSYHPLQHVDLILNWLFQEENGQIIPSSKDSIFIISKEQGWVVITMIIISQVFFLWKPKLNKLMTPTLLPMLCSGYKLEEILWEGGCSPWAQICCSGIILGRRSWFTWWGYFLCDALERAGKSWDYTL